MKKQETLILGDGNYKYNKKGNGLYYFEGSYMLFEAAWNLIFYRKCEELLKKPEFSKLPFSFIKSKVLITCKNKPLAMAKFNAKLQEYEVVQY